MLVIIIRAFSKKRIATANIFQLWVAMSREVKHFEAKLFSRVLKKISQQ